MKFRAPVIILGAFVGCLAGCGAPVKQTDVPYAAQPWPSRIWKSEVPEGCPFGPSEAAIPDPGRF
jgi:hypothetical protein